MQLRVVPGCFRTESIRCHGASGPETKRRLKATADEDIPPKGKVRLDVTFPVSGARAFFCKFHGPVGMNGQLLIGDTAPSGPR